MPTETCGHRSKALNAGVMMRMEIKTNGFEMDRLCEDCGTNGEHEAAKRDKVAASGTS